MPKLHNLWHSNILQIIKSRSRLELNLWGCKIAMCKFILLENWAKSFYGNFIQDGWWILWWVDDLFGWELWVCDGRFSYTENLWKWPWVSIIVNIESRVVSGW